MSITFTPVNNHLNPDADTGMVFLASDLRYIADRAFAEADALTEYHGFEHLWEIGCDFRDMSQGRIPATWKSVSFWLSEYHSLGFKVTGDILDLLVEMEESV